MGANPPADSATVVVVSGTVVSSINVVSEDSVVSGAMVEVSPVGSLDEQETSATTMTVVRAMRPLFIWQRVVPLGAYSGENHEES